MTLVTLTHQETKEKHEFSLTGSPTPSFEKLVDTISSLMGLDPPFKVKYMDEENELVTISSDIELATALESPTLSLVIIGGKRTPTKSTLDYALPVSREAREAESFVRSRQEAHIPIPIPDFLPEDLESAPASPLDTIPPAPAQAEPGTPSSHAHPHRQLELPEPETEPESEPQAAQNSAQELARQKHIITSLILKAFLGIKDETLADNEQDLLRYAGAVYGLASALIPPGPSHSIVAQEVVSGLEACGYRVDSPSQAQLLEAFSSAKANDSLPSGSITGAWRFTETESTVFINPTPRKAPPVVSSEEEEQPTTRSADEQVEVGALAAVPEPQQAPKSEDDFVLVSDEEQDQPTAKAEQEQQEHEERQKEEEEQKQKQKQEEEQEEEEQRQKKEEEQRQKKEEEERQKKEEEERQKEEEERQREEEKRQREEEQRQKKRQQEEEEKRQQEEEKRQQEEDERQREEEEEKKRQEEEDERQRDEEDSDGELLKKNSDQELFEKVKEFDPYANRDRDLDLEPIADLEMDSVEDVSFSGDNKPQWARTFPEDQSEGESDDNDSFQNAMSTLQPQQPQPPFEDPRAFHGYPHRDRDHDHDLYHDHNNGAYHDPYPQVFAQHHQRQDHGHHAQPQAPAHAEPPQQLDEADQVAQLTDMGFTDMDLIFDAIKKFPTYEERVNFLLERSSRT